MGKPFGGLLELLERMALQSGAELIQHATTWRDADEDARFYAVHLIGSAIGALRERHGMPPFDDPLPGEPDSVFLIIRNLLA